MSKMSSTSSIRRQLTGPEMVPVAHMSPGCILQPLTVWCASCWVTDQYMYLRLDKVTRSYVDELDAMYIKVNNRIHKQGDS